MTQETLVKLAATAESTAGAVTFRIPKYMFDEGAKPSVMLQGLATTNVVTFHVANGSGWTPMYDDQATPAAVVLDYDSDKFTVTFNSPGLYSVTHTALGAVRKLVATY